MVGIIARNYRIERALLHIAHCSYAPQLPVSLISVSRSSRKEESSRDFLGTNKG